MYYHGWVILICSSEFSELSIVALNDVLLNLIPVLGSRTIFLTFGVCSGEVLFGGTMFEVN